MRLIDRGSKRERRSEEEKKKGKLMDREKERQREREREGERERKRGLVYTNFLTICCYDANEFVGPHYPIFHLQECNVAYFCPEGTSSPTPDNGFCPLGHYCNGGAAAIP